MNDYEVRFEFELVVVTTYVDAVNEVEARRLAEQQVANSTGFAMGDAHGCVVTKVGWYSDKLVVA